MPLYLVRHAKAGSRHDFDGSDRDRPLTNSGRRQASALAVVPDGNGIGVGEEVDVMLLA